MKTPFRDMYLSWLAERRRVRALMYPDERPAQREANILSTLRGRRVLVIDYQTEPLLPGDDRPDPFKDFNYFPIVHIDAAQMEQRALFLVPGWRWEPTEGGGYLAPPDAVLPRDV